MSVKSCVPKYSIWHYYFRRIDLSWWTHWTISHSSQFSIAGITKAMVCTIYPVCGMLHIKDLLLLIRKNSPCSGSIRFPLLWSKRSFAICLMPYNHKSKCVVLCYIKHFLLSLLYFMASSFPNDYSLLTFYMQHWMLYNMFLLACSELVAPW